MNYLALLLCFTIFQFSNSIVVSEGKMMDERLAEKWCGSFGEGKCPFDDFCFHNKVRGDLHACRYCPSGGRESDCNKSVATKHYYERRNNSERHKYYLNFKSIKVILS